MIMKKLRKPRLVLLVLMLTLLVGTISFGAIGLLSTTSDTTVEPIVFRFNSIESVESLLVRDSDDNKVSLYHNSEEGKTGFTETTSKKNAYIHVVDTVNKVNTHVPTITLDDYRYVLISWKRESATGDVARFYYNTGSGFKYFGIRGGTDKGWTTSLLDIEGGIFYNYDATGEEFYREKFLTDSTGTFSTWTGDATQLRLDFTHGITTSRTITVEYIGLLSESPVNDDGDLTYSVAMPNDAAAEAIATKLENEMNVSYEQVNTEETATTYVQSKLSQDVADYCTENYPDLANRVETEITDYDVTAESGGTISVKATMYLGEVLFQTRKEMDITIHVDARLAPVAVVFNTSAKVEEATFYNDTDATFTKSFVDDTTNDGKKYMHLEIATEGNIFDTYLRNFLEVADATTTFSFDEYPYMKISYRRNVPDTMSGEQMYMYIMPENENVDKLSSVFNLYKVGTGETTYWQEMVADMRSNTATLFTDKDGAVEERTTTFTNEYIWKGNLGGANYGGKYSLRFDFTKYGGAGTREIDIEYIAFFSTEEEAREYNPALAEVDTLKANSSATWDNSVTTKELAIAKAEEYINRFGFTTVREIKEGTFTAPTTQANGSYIFDVVFTDGSVVTVTITIEKLIEPIVYTLDNSDVIGKFWNHPYLTMSLENGYMKMVKMDQHLSVNNCFYIEGSYPTIGESFEIDDRKYFKVRYRLSGTSEATSPETLQVFYWVEGKDTAYSRSIYFDGVATNGDIIELIMDMSVADTTTNAVWIKNVTENGENGKYEECKFGAWTTGECTGTITKFRFTPAITKNLKFDADVEYIGFFNKLEDAKAYSGAADERLDYYQQLLESLELNLEWGNGNTREKAIAGAKALIEKQIGCNVTIQNYLAPTAKAEGRITFSAEVVSGGVKRTVKDLSATIDKEPTPFTWWFNNLDMINSLTFNPNTKATLNDYAMKMEYENGNSGSEFQFIVETPADKPQFDLQNYPYIMVKYKRNGIGPVLINYKTNTYNGTFTEIGRYGLGTKENSWYTSIVDTTVKNHEQPLVWNFNHDDSRWNWNYYLPINQKIMENDNFQGLSQNFTFTFKTMGQPQANAYVEYIAFFPTMKAALEYKDMYYGTINECTYDMSTALGITSK